MQLKSSIAILKGVGKVRMRQYEKLKISSVKDLLCHFPVGYINCSEAKTLKELKEKEKAAVEVKILNKKAMKTRNNKYIFKILAQDKEGEIVEIVYFNNAYIYAALKIGGFYKLYGEFSDNFHGKKVLSPLILNEFGFIAKYGLTKGLTKNVLVSNLKQAFKLIEDNEDVLPKSLRVKYNLLNFKAAIFKIHFPKNAHDYYSARKRLVFEELLIWQIGILKFRKQDEEKECFALKDVNLKEFLKGLPFSLTSAQSRVIEECIKDCSKSTPMNRLVQGDVGSGKTVVAVALSFLFAKAKKEVVLMAPTEILARQHYKTFCSFLNGFGIRVGLLVGGLKKREKSELLEKLKTGEINVVVGTHALFYDDVVFNNLSLIITDEQHRFGVKQREKLKNKAFAAHVLVMSATPIPRTLALIFYGDLNISTIDELPPNRVPVKTFWVTSKKRDSVLKFVLGEISNGHQAYFVCPAIEEGENFKANVLNYAETLKENGFEKERIGILHGRMEACLKNEVMLKFLNREIDVLVSTTVIEVGVDVSNATVMVIENAEMFGLSQLHQLRGRVARSCFKAYCFLVSDFLTKENKQRMGVMCSTTDGFEISKKDLVLRGPGDIFKEQQHGKFNFKIANLKRDFNCAKICRKEAEEILRKDYELKDEENLKIKENVEKFINNSLTVL